MKPFPNKFLILSIDMKIPLFLLFLFIATILCSCAGTSSKAAYSQQQQRIAIINTEDDGEPSMAFLELVYLTDKLREIAGKTLPKTDYVIMTQQSIVDMLGSQEQAAKTCREATCLAELGRKVNADYIAQARIGRFGDNLTIKIELYGVGNGSLIASFTDNSKDVHGLLAILEVKTATLFADMPGTSSKANVSKINAEPQVSETAVQIEVISGDTFTDPRDQQKYKVKRIGDYYWFLKDLNLHGKDTYDWNEAKSACPKGWRLPNNSEWNSLKATLNKDELQDFFNVYDIQLWSSSEYLSTIAYQQYVFNKGKAISEMTGNKGLFCFVRCIKD
jgi:hypothetical protein